MVVVIPVLRIGDIMNAIKRLSLPTGPPRADGDVLLKWKSCHMMRHRQVDCVGQEEFSFGDAWVPELHRASADGLDLDEAARRGGLSYGTTERSQDVGECVRRSFVLNGVHPRSWARPSCLCHIV